MKTYSIKEGYEHRAVNITLEAAKLMRREGLGSVLDVGCGTACKLGARA